MESEFTVKVEEARGFGASLFYFKVTTDVWNAEIEAENQFFHLVESAIKVLVGHKYWGLPPKQFKGRRHSYDRNRNPTYWISGVLLISDIRIPGWEEVK